MALAKDREIINKEKEAMLLKQLDKLMTSLSSEDYKQALLTLQICFKNIDLHPHNDKYCQIKLNNKRFCSKVWQYPAGEEFMKMSGWEVEGDLIKLKDDSYVRIALKLLKARQECIHMKGVLTVSQFEALALAVVNEQIEEVDTLLQDCGITSAGRVFCEDGSSMNLLCAAITTHQTDIVELLVEDYDVDPHIIDTHSNNYKPCLFRIFDEATEDFIIGFITAAVVINVCLKHDGYNFLQTAVMTNCLEVVSFLFKRPNMAARVNETDGCRRTLLHLAYLSGNPEMVQLLIKYNANQRATDIYGKKPYDYVKGDPEFVDYSKYAQNSRKIHDDPLSIEFNYYIKLLMSGLHPKEAVSNTMEEFTWLKEKHPFRLQYPNQETIRKDLASFLINKPACMP